MSNAIRSLVVCVMVTIAPLYIEVGWTLEEKNGVFTAASADAGNRARWIWHALGLTWRPSLPFYHPRVLMGVVEVRSLGGHVTSLIR